MGARKNKRNELGKLIARYCIDNEISLPQFADEIGITKQAICQYSVGTRVLGNNEVLEKIRNALGLDFLTFYRIIFNDYYSKMYKRIMRIMKDNDIADDDLISIYSILLTKGYNND